jgi:hypothetical protein
VVVLYPQLTLNGYHQSHTGIKFARIPVKDLERALAVIKHKPDDVVGQAVIQKLDVDKDGFVELWSCKVRGLGEPLGYLMGM